ncbi:MAG: dihydroneopterin aldolase [Gammaproteobacteria bacterium]|nr:dihydroneopterin aldolase [Gammaproteobacteria bacterium]
MDRIFIQDLRIDAVIGIYEWERKIKQTLSFDLEIACDCRKAATTDSVDDTVNYKKVSKTLQEFVGSSEFRLVETLAERAAGLLMDEFSIGWLRLRVNKMGALRGAAGVGVVVERGEAG